MIKKVLYRNIIHEMIKELFFLKHTRALFFPAVYLFPQPTVISYFLSYNRL